MTTPPAVSPPPPEAPPEPSQPTPTVPSHTPLRRFGRRAASGRPSAGALAGSIAVHAALLVVAVAFIRFGPRLLDRGAPPAEVVEYIDIAFPDAGTGVAAAPGAPAGAPQLPAAPAPAETPPTTEPGARPQAPGEDLVFPSGTPTGLPQAGGAPAVPGTGTGGAGGQPGGTGTGEGALRPGIRDPRLFPTQRPVPAKPEQTEHEVYMERLGATLKEYNDSVAAEAERARNALDWTLKDKDGNSWGVSPGKIHLGKVTLPNPFGMAGSPQAREESEREARQRGEIDRQVADRERRNSFQERVKATRERKDAERKLIRGES